MIDKQFARNLIGVIRRRIQGHSKKQAEIFSHSKRIDELTGKSYKNNDEAFILTVFIRIIV
jgi:hypothetical protein